MDEAEDAWLDDRGADPDQPGDEHRHGPDDVQRLVEDGREPARGLRDLGHQCHGAERERLPWRFTRLRRCRATSRKRGNKPPMKSGRYTRKPPRVA